MKKIIDFNNSYSFLLRYLLDKIIKKLPFSNEFSKVIYYKKNLVKSKKILYKSIV